MWQAIIMKQIFMTLAVIASLCVFGSCSKEGDGPKGGKVSGNVQLDGNKFSVKYGYLFGDERDFDVVFCDKDVSKYIIVDGYDEDDDAPDIEISYVGITKYRSQIEGIDLAYKANPKRGKGYYYDNYDSNLGDKISFSLDGDKVKLSASSITVDKYKVLPGGDSEDNSIGTAKASFDVSGNVKSYYDDYDDYDELTRSIDISTDVIVTVIKDPKQFARLKALIGKK